MSEDFEERVLPELADIRTTLGTHGRQLEAIVHRLDEQDMTMDQLTSKIDRQATASNLAMQAAEQALTSATSLERRVGRLERDAGT